MLFFTNPPDQLVSWLTSHYSITQICFQQFLENYTWLYRASDFSDQSSSVFSTFSTWATFFHLRCSDPSIEKHSHNKTTTSLLLSMGEYWLLHPQCSTVLLRVASSRGYWRTWSHGRDVLVHRAQTRTGPQINRIYKYIFVWQRANFSQFVGGIAR